MYISINDVHMTVITINKTKQTINIVNRVCNKTFSYFKYQTVGDHMFVDIKEGDQYGTISFPTDKIILIELK